MFETTRENDILFIRLTSDTITDSDTHAIVASVEQLLLKGAADIAFAVTVGALSNQLRISALLLLVKDIAFRHRARLFLVENNADGNGIYKTLCATLHIPRYDNEHELLATVRLKEPAVPADTPVFKET
ncbi:MAG: hypothetical protein JXA71_02300 [Chitinispirillaceae bacterium]|nr:hypothetical protein [Chitinispirillaceae bacterium]